MLERIGSYGAYFEKVMGKICKELSKLKLKTHKEYPFRNLGVQDP